MTERRQTTDDLKKAGRNRHMATLLRWLPPALALGLLGSTALPAAPRGATVGLTVEHAVFVMRHGVRPPTGDPARRPGHAAEPWPAWSVQYGWLTEHGAEAIRLLGATDRRWLRDEGLLPGTGCPAPGALSLHSDDGERTVATAEAWARGLGPDCSITNEHAPDHDPLFEAMPDKASFDSAAAYQSVRAALGPGGIAGLQRREQRALDTIDRILCGPQRTGCGMPDKSSKLVAPKPGPGEKPGVEGALSDGSSVAQIVLLEYAEGKPMKDVGWGRASAADIELIGTLHSAGFAVVNGAPYVARHSFPALHARMLSALGDGAPPVTVLVGHDTNVASLGGLLGLHWHVPGFGADDPGPGGALVFETVRNGSGQRFVRVFYRSQTLDQIRNLSPDTPARLAVPIGACGAKPVLLCPKATFDKLLAGGTGARPVS